MTVGEANWRIVMQMMMLLGPWTLEDRSHKIGADKSALLKMGTAFLFCAFKDFDMRDILTVC